MKRIYYAAFISFCLLTLSGCMSFAARYDPSIYDNKNQFYPGVKLTFDVIEEDSPYFPGKILFIDLPFTLVADTLLIPIDALHGPYTVN